MEKKSILKMAVFGVLTIVFAVLGIVTGVWKDGAEAVGIQFNLSNILRILVMIFGTLFAAALAVFVLKLFKPENHRARTMLTLASNIIRYIAVIVIIGGILTILSVDVATVIAGLGIIALIIGFGAESLISDMVTGLFILIDNQYNVGDIIEVNGFRGTVTEIGIRTTCVTDPGGNVKIINNSDMKNILNRSEMSSRAVADFAIPYQTDLPALEEKIPALLEEIYWQHTDKMKAVPLYLGVQELGASSVNLRFVVEVGESDIYSVGRILNHDLFIGFRRLGVECPFQQVDVHTD